MIMIIIKSMMLGYWDDVPYFQDGCGMLGARSHFSPSSLDAVAIVEVGPIQAVTSRSMPQPVRGAATTEQTII